MLNPDHPFNSQPFTENVPAPVRTWKFQEDLTRLFGRHDATGKPWVRIIWAQSNERDDDGEWLAKDWNEYGAGGYGEWRRRYLYSSHSSMEEAFDEVRQLFVAREVWHDVSPPRFVLEKFIPPEIACMGWDDRLTPLESAPNFAEGRDADGDRLTARKPVRGLYVPIEIDDRAMIRGGVLAAHAFDCCKLAQLEQSQCYGYYVEPGEAHMEIARRLAAALQQVRERRPGIMSQEEHAAANLRSRKRDQEYTANYEQRIRQIVTDAFKTHRGGLLSESPTAQKWGRFNFLSGHNPAGTPTKKEES